MRSVVRPTPRRWLRRCAQAAGLVAWLAHPGCDAGAPVDLQAIRQQQAGGDFEGSIEPLRELLAGHPDDPEANYLYGRALSATQRANLATWSLRKAMEDPAWLVPAGLQLAFAGLASQDFNEVDAVTGRILEQEPENVTALLLRAQAHAHWKKDPERALADAERVLELDPERLAAYEPRILALVALGRKEEARAALAEVGGLLAERDTDPKVLAWHCSTTAIFQEDAGDLERADEAWSGCLETYPADPGVVQGAIRFFDSRGEPDRSLEAAEAALAEAPASRLFHVTVAQRLVIAGRAAEAEAVLREQTSSDNPQVAAAAWVDVAKLRQDLREYGAAAEALARAIELAREWGTPNPQLEFDYADTLVAAGQLGRAMTVAEGLGVPAHQHLIKARVAQERGDPRRALEEFDAGLRLWPDNAYARYYAAVAAESLGDFDRALEEYRYAIRNSPGATDARTRCAALLVAEGKPRQAREVLYAGARGGTAPVEIEGHLLAMRVSGLLGDVTTLSRALEQLEKNRPGLIGRALVEAAEGLALRAGPAVAVEMLTSAPTVDYTQLRYAPALRALLRFGHEAGDPAAGRAALAAALAAHPESGVLQEIRGLDLELSGAPPEDVRAAYTKAVELAPRNAPALMGLGRLALPDDPAAALGFFDRAAAADPSDPEPRLQAARALVASGRPDEAAQRLDALLATHPYEAEAAAERARLDLERGVATPATLERARRAVRFRGGVEALELLSRVHEQRGEAEPAAEAAQRAQALREAEASRDTASEG